MKKTVLVTATNYSKYCGAAKRLLEDAGLEVIENTHGRPLTFEEIQPVISAVDAVIAGVDPWNERVFRLAPKLRIIARFGVGTDNIDLVSARNHGISVTNVKGANADSVADLAAGLILASLRNIPGLDAGVRTGRWERFMGHELTGKTVGLLGFGAIAQKLSRRLGGFGVRLIAYDLYPSREAACALGVTLLDSADEVFRNSDIVSLHLPVTGQTRNAIGAAQLRLMKDGACLINTARGALVDEKALCRELETGRISAAVDVYGEEPVRSDNPLFRFHNTVCTPHTAGETYEAYERIGIATAQAILDCFSGKTPENLLN